MHGDIDFSLAIAQAVYRFCSLQNFFLELGQYERGTLDFFVKQGVSSCPALSADLPVADEHPVPFDKISQVFEFSGVEAALLAPFTIHDFAGYAAFEFGILSQDSKRTAMFQFHPDGQELLEKWYYKTNSQVDSLAFNSLFTDAGICSNKLYSGVEVASIYFGIVEDQCVLREGIYRPRVRPPCALLSWFDQTLDPVSAIIPDSGNKDYSSCSNLPTLPPWADALRAFVSNHAELQNMFKYHDVLHSSLFATGMYLQLEKYNITSPHRKVDDNIVIAATMAGLMHDVGYWLLRRWLICTNLCTYDPETQKFDSNCNAADKGHEIVSLIASVMLLRGSGEATQPILDAMAYVILTTKITVAMSATGVDEIADVLNHDKADTVFHRTPGTSCREFS